MEEYVCQQLPLEECMSATTYEKMYVSNYLWKNVCQVLPMEECMSATTVRRMYVSYYLWKNICQLLPVGECMTASTYERMYVSNYLLKNVWQKLPVEEYMSAITCYRIVCFLISKGFLTEQFIISMNGFQVQSEFKYTLKAFRSFTSTFIFLQISILHCKTWC